MTHRNDIAERALPVGGSGAGRPGPGQSTQVEMSRATAQVLAQVEIARRFPRDPHAVRAAMIRACSSYAVAEKAFYAYPRGGKTVKGPAIGLARELARCWGNLDYGITELSQDLVNGESEIKAYAWDLETNTQVSSTYVVPHARDLEKGSGRQVLTALRDISENNTNIGSRRMRECLFSLIPKALRDEMIDLCEKTKEAGPKDTTTGRAVPIEQRRQNAVKSFAAKGVELARLEKHVGSPVGRWDGRAIADLEVIYESIRRHELTVDVAFPTSVSGEDILGGDPHASAELDEADALDEPLPPVPYDPGEEPAGWGPVAPNAGSAE